MVDVPEMCADRRAPDAGDRVDWALALRYDCRRLPVPLQVIVSREATRAYSSGVLIFVSSRPSGSNASSAAPFDQVHPQRINRLADPSHSPVNRTADRWCRRPRIHGAERMQALPVPRHRGVAIPAGRGEELEKRSCDVRHVARKHQGPIRRGTHQCGVEPAECADARQPIRYDLHAADVALGAANDDDSGRTAVERGQLPIEDASIGHDERALVLATQAAGLPAGEDVRVPEHAR